MEKVKVLMVLGSLDMGGAQMHILNLLENMDLNKFQVDFAVNFVMKANGIEEEITALGCNIYIMPYFRVYNYRHFKNSWRKFFQSHNYNIVHGHSTNSASIYLKVAKKAGCVTIAHCHSAGFRGNWIVRIAKRFFSKNVRNVADYWFACSAKAGEHLFGKVFWDYENHYIIPNAINVEKYRYNRIIANRLREENGISQTDFLCGHVGSFSSPKNHQFLLEIFKEVCKYKKNAKLICCGTGPLIDKIRKRAYDLGLYDRIIFAGVVKNCNDYLMAMDVLIFPSLFEGLPVSVVEAQATGLPIVMSDVITDEVILTDDVYSCSLVDSADKWAQCIIKVTPGDRICCNSIIEDSRYNIQECVNMVQALYMEMCHDEAKNATIVNEA